MKSHSPKNQKRNEEELRTLQESGAHIARARFDSVPEAGKFRGQLKTKLLNTREQKRSSMWNKIQSGVKALFPERRYLVGALVFVLVVGMVGVLVWNRPGSPHAPNLFISPVFAQDNFEVTATQGDDLAVESTTQFVITSKTPVDANALKQNIVLEPDVDFSFEAKSDTEFVVTPKKQLEAKNIYTLQIESQYLDENQVAVERDFSWAFQVKSDAQIIQTLPTDMATNVPTDSGIEFVFNTEGYDNYENAITFEPALKGQFERHGRTLVFVPRELKKETIYTVTVSKDLQIQGADPLREDYVFQFETRFDNERNYDWWYVRDTFLEFSSTQEPFLTVYGRKAEVSEFQVSVYAFASAETFVDALSTKQQYPNWSFASRRQDAINVSSLQKVSDFSVPSSKYRSYEYLVFPETLPAGFYVANIEKDGFSQQSLIQISDLASFVSVSENETLLWVNNLKTKQSVSNATVSVPATGYTAALDDTGLLSIPTNKIFEDPKSRNGRSQASLLIKSGQLSSVVPVYYGSYYLYDDPWSPSGKNDEYWNYASLDRNVYLPNDEISFWGMIQARDEKSQSPNELKVSIQQGGYYWYAFSENLLYPKTTVSLDSDGYFEGNLKLSDLAPGAYRVIFEDNDQLIASKFITVEQYTKPAYTISLESDKRSVFPGESVSFQTQAKFFEGTPIPGLELSHDRGTVTTDKDGQAQFVVPFEKSPCEIVTRKNCRSYVSSEYIDVQPKRPEEGEIRVEKKITIYPAQVDFFASQFLYTNTNTAFVSSTLSQLDLAPLNNDDPNDDASYRVGPAANKRVTGIITETSYERKETGQYYDFINKRVQKQYHYERKERELTRFDTRTDQNGQIYYELSNLNQENTYEVELFADDGTGRVAYDGRFLYTPYGYNRSSDYTWYTLLPEVKNDYHYGLTERVNLLLHQNDAPMESLEGPVLYYQVQQGLKHFELSDKPVYSFEFQEEHIPNVFVSAVYFDGKNYRFTGDAWTRSSILYDTSERKLNLEVSPDKTRYVPGEEMKIRVRVTDQNGNPHASRVNIKFIDEAYYAIGGYNPDPLSDLYQSVSSKEVYTYQTHRFSELMDSATGAEMGCFLAGTKILMADGTQKNIEDIVAGDEILTFEHEASRKLVSGRVVETQNHVVDTYLVFNDTLRVTPEHIVFADGKWKTAGSVREGEVMRTSDGQLTPIEQIEVRHEIVEVFNFHVETYHTYVADGFYVHNDKGDGSGVRQFFPDVALFEMIQTDSNGEAEVSMRVPDSITSWRLTTEAVSNDLFAGVDVQQVPVSLPLFAQVNFPNVLIANDQPDFTIRAYGSALDSNDSVVATVEAPFLPEGKSSVSGKPFTSLSVSFPALSVGNFAVTSSVVSGDLRDALLTPFQVIPTHLKKNVYTNMKVENGRLVSEEGTALPDQIIGPVELVVSSLGQSKLYRDLLWLSCDCGQRIDQRIGSIVGTTLLKDVFGETRTASDFAVAPYQNDNGGIQLLPYSASDVELSAKMAALEVKVIDQVALTRYLYKFVLNSKSHSREEVAAALYGLAGAGEPVLPAIKSFGAQDDLTPKEQLYIALAAAELGDREYARKLYRSVADAHMQVALPIAKMNVGDHESVIDHTALAAVLAASIDEKYASELIRFVKEEPTQETLTTLEQLLFVKNALPHLSAEPVRIVFDVEGETETVELENGEIRTVVLPSDKLSSLQVSEADGPVGITLKYVVSLTAESESRSGSVSINKQYFVNDVPVTSFKAGDLVEIRLSPFVSPVAPRGAYEIRDVLPSGLTAITGASYHSREAINNKWCRLYPYFREGQSLRFDYYGSGSSYRCSSWSYYARVSTAGTFESEPALIQSLENPNILNFGGYDGTVTISQ